MNSPVLLLLALSAGVLAGPINVRLGEPNQCALRCTESRKFQYEPGTTYIFDYKVQTETSMEGASEDKSVLGITATAHIEVLSKCDMALRLSDVVLSPASPDYIPALEDNVMRFSFQDGKIEDLCPLAEEQDWTMNVKKGVLSVFQNSMDNLEVDQTVHETDVTGECPAEYKLVNKGWYVTAIKKTKHLLGCMDRHGWRSSMQAAAYRVPSEVQSLPLMKSEHVCDQDITNEGYLKSALCKETHVFRPFSNYNNGSMTQIVQKLSFRNKQKYIRTSQGAVDRRASLLFTHSAGQHTMERQEQKVRETLRQLCTLTVNDIRPEVPMLFSQLIFQMRGLDANTLRTIYRETTRGNICTENVEKTKKFFQDAIPMLGTSSSVQILKELIMSKAVTGIEADMWLSSLALIQDPTVEMLAEVKALLDMRELGDEPMLYISALVNNYCTKHTDCAEDFEVTGIISSLQRNLGYGCVVRDENLEKVLMTLRAIGNAGHSTTVGSAIAYCFNRESNPIEVRVAALDAFRRLPCSTERSEAMDLVKDKDEDSELRIAAYLAVMKCPTAETIEEVRNILAKEETNQVGSFIWSHLTNLMESSSPHKEAVRSIVDDERLKKEFDLEKIKFSRNYEGSFLFERINTGAMAESNVIWSSKSFIPRSAMLNLTVDLFGNSVNLLEVGGRIEGFEYLMETYLGPYGYFGQQQSKKSIEKSRAKLDQLRGSMYMRIFGNEMVYKHFKGLESLKSPDFNFLDFLIKISKKHDYSFSQSSMFLDSSMIIPTSCGLPLNLTVTGVSSIDMKASGTVDLRKVAAKPRSLNIDGIIKPSGAVTISGSMSVDGLFSKSGMKMTTTLHTSTELNGRVKLERGKVLEVEFDTPQDKMEILDIKSTFFTIMGKTEKEQAMITDNQKARSFCTGSKMAKIVGMELCGEVQYPNASMVDAAPYFPFTGPVHLNLILHKRDSHVAYRLMAKRLETKEKSIAQLAFTTPGSKVKRDISVDYALDFNKKEMEMSSTSPWTNMVLKGNVVLDDDKKAFKGSFTKDGKLYGIQSVVDVKNEQKTTKLAPKVEIIRPGMKNIVLAGTIDVEGLKRFETDLSLINAISHPISLRGTIIDTKKEKSIKTSVQYDESGEYSLNAVLQSDFNTNKNFLRVVPKLIIKTPVEHLITVDGHVEHRQGKLLSGELNTNIKDLLRKPISVKFTNVISNRKKNTRYDTDLKITSKWMTAKVDSTVNKGKNGQMSSRVVVDYNINKVSKNKLILSGKFTNKTTSLTKYTLTTNFENKKNPDYNCNTKLDLSHNNKHTEATVDVRYGKDLNAKKTNNRVFLDATVNRKGGWKSATVDYNFVAEIPSKDIGLILSGDHKHDRNDLVNTMVLTSNKVQKAKTNLKLNYKNSKQINVGGDFTLVYPGSTININTDLIQKKKEYTHSLNMKINKKKSTMTTIYSQPGKGRHQIQSDVSLHFLKPISISGSTNLNLDKFKAVTDVKYGNDKYGFETNKISKDNYNHAIGVSAYCPEQAVTADLETKMSGNTYGGRLVTNWDASEKKSSSRVVIDGSAEVKSLADMNGMVKIVYPGRTINLNGEHRHQGPQSINSHVDLSWSPKEKIILDMNHQTDSNDKMSSDFTISTPFKALPKLSTELSYGNNPNDIATSAKVTYGRNVVVSTDVTVRKPLSLMRSNVQLNVHTFLSKFRDLNAKLSHNIGDRLRATASGTLDGRKINFDMSGEHTSRSMNDNSVEGTITLTTDFESVRSLVLRTSAAQSNQKFIGNMYLDHNGKVYKYDLDMMDKSYRTNMDYSGKVRITTPYYRGEHEASAVITDNDMQLTLNSDMGRGKQIYFDVSGRHELRATRTMSGKMVLRTPWKPVRDIDVEMTHEHGEGIVSHNTLVKSNGKTISSGQLNYNRHPNKVVFSAKATSPFYEDLSTSIDMTTRAPYTSRMEFMWSPRQKITVDSSFNGDLPTVEGSLRVITPFQQARNIFLTASNKQDGEDWVSSGNIEYSIRKSINFETRFGMAGRKIVRAVVTTPFETFTRMETGMELSANGYDVNGHADFQIEPIVGKFSASVNADWSADFTGKARLETPYREFPYTQVEFASKKDAKGRHSQVEIEYSPRQIISLDNLYSLEYPIVFDIELKTPFEHLQDVGGKVRHNMGRRGVQTHAEVTYAPYKTIESDLKLKWKNGIAGNLVVKTPFAGYEVSRTSFTHNGVLTDFKTNGEFEVMNKRVDVDLTFRHGMDTTAELIFHSPFEGFEELKASMNKRGAMDDINVDTALTYGNNQEITVKANNKIAAGVLKTGFTFKNPYTAPFKFDIDFNGMPTAFNLQLESSLGNENKIEHHTRSIIRLPRIDITNNFEYRLADEGRKYGFKVNTEGEQWSDIKYSTEASCNEHKASVSGYWKMMDKIMGSLLITAPSVMEDEIAAAFSHEGTLERFDTSANLRFFDQAYSGRMNLYRDGIKQVRTSGELSTPFQGFEDMKYDYNHEFTGSSLVGHAKVDYGYNQEIVAELDVALAPNMSGTLTVNTPFKHYKQNKLVVIKKGQLNDMVVETSFENNRKPVFKYTVTHVYLPRRMESSVSLEGIYMEDVSASFKHTGEPMVDCYTEMKYTYGKLLTGSYTSNIKRTARGMTVDLNGDYSYYGKDQKASLNMERDGAWNDGTIRATAGLDGKEISAQGTYSFASNKADIDATASTPFPGFGDLSANIHYTLNGNRIDSSNTALQYMDGQRISVKGYFLQNNDWRYVDSDVEVSTPFRGFESNKFVYTGRMDGSSLDVSTSFENQRLQKIASSLKVKSDYENSLDWTLNTPFEGYEDISFMTNMKKNINKPSIDMKFRNGQNDYQIQGDLNREVSPITGEVRIITPIKNYERTDVSFSHSGNLDNFKTSATFDSRLTGRMDGEASLKYISPLNMDISAEIRSRVPNMEDLAVKIKTAENRNDKSCYLMTKWTNRDIVELDGSYKERSRWSSDQRIGELRLSTPFEALKTASVNLDWNKNGDKYSEKLSASLNDQSIVDMDVDVTVSGVPEISARMDKPYPVQVTVSGQNGHTIGGDIFVNWDTTQREKNVRLQTSFTPNGGRFDTDKEFNIKLIHPVRTFGLNGFLQASDKHVKSNGAVIWNENKGQKFAYDLDMSDSTRRNKVAMDGSLKLVFPDRSLAFQGAVKNVRNMKSVDGYLMWDADKDDDKKIGLKAVMVPGSRTNKFDVTLSIPTIQRDIKIDSEITVDSGRVIFDGKTEFSYSTDSSKTLVLTSNVKDVSYDREHTNYTMSLGIRHSYTDTDVQLTSHIGHSSDRYSTGMELQYLTASRKKMNMVVLGEIDQLRRQINIEVMNPMKKMRILGEVESVSPFKASIKNEIDNRPGVSAAVAFSDRSFDFQTHYDINDLAKSFHVEGEYVNSTAVKADAYSMINGQRIADSMMTARLNTSRILHTRLSWRPTLLSELEMFSAKQMESLMAASEAMSREAKAEIGREIQYKYNRIMKAVNEEMKPYIELLRNELVHFESQLEYILQEIRRMYGRNDLYIKNMGDKFNEYYLRTHMGLRELVGQYRESYNQMFQQISHHMDTVKAYPVRQKYYELLYRGERMADEVLEDISNFLIECTRKLSVYIDKQSMALRQNIDLAKENIANHPYVQLLKEKMRNLKSVDYAGYVRDYSQSLGKKVESLNIGGQYSAALNNIHGLVNHHIDELMKREDVKYMHSVVNDAYQEGKWAFNYWKVEENMRKQMHEMYSMLKQLIRSEIEAYKHQYFTILPRYNVTYYNPQQAELQADIYLPLPVTALDRVPDDVISAYVSDAKRMANNYLPTKESVMKMYYDYFPQTTNETEVDKEFKEYMQIPTKRRLRSRRQRRRKQ